MLVGPFALSFHMHYPDEMYYTDAAVKMLQNGDYLTTYLGSGELRFKKPIGTYWAVLAGFKLFGVTAFASRFFFLIAGVATVGLTYCLSRVIFEDKRIASLSCLIMASNPVLIFSATRSIPDVLLVMTLTASAIGFAGMIKFGNRAPDIFLWLLYLSLALAFEIKGLPAAALGLLGLLYLALNPWNRIPVRTLIHLPSLLVGTFIALFWFVAMWDIHGPTYLNSFIEDQVGVRVASRIALIFQNGLTAILLLIAMFIPWVFFAIPRAGIVLTVKKIWNENPAFFGFIILWTVAILVMGAMTSRFYERYLLPVAPVLAVGLGWLLMRANFEVKLRGLRAAAAFFLLLNFILLIFSLWLNLRLGSHPMVYLQLFLGALLLLYLVRIFSLGQKLPSIISYSILLLFFLISSGTYQISLPDQGSQLSSFVSEHSKKPDTIIGYAGNLHTSSKIRIGLGPRFTLIDLAEENLGQSGAEFSALILEDRLLEKVDTSAYYVQLAAQNWNSRKIPDLIMAAGSHRFDSLLTSTGRKYYWLQKK